MKDDNISRIDDKVTRVFKNDILQLHRKFDKKKYLAKVSKEKNIMYECSRLDSRSQLMSRGNKKIRHILVLNFMIFIIEFLYAYFDLPVRKL